MRDRLAPGGSVIVNLGHPEGHDELEKVLTATMGSAFDHVVRDPIEPTNTLLIGSQTHAHGGATCRAAAPPGGAAPARPRLAPTGWSGPLKGGAVYTDDKAPVEWLIDKSIVEYAAGG